ncbi:MAG: hypothetical protein P8Y72_07235 [Anaerolineales bacterium]|jgi:tetratricopeptide (TPR) repeat protein
MGTSDIENIVASAKSYFQAKDYQNAIEGFLVAHAHYKDIEDEINAAEMANNLSVAYLQLGKKDMALSYVEGTDLVFEANNDISKQAIALGNYGAALESLKKFDAAAAAYQKSADLFELSGDKELRSHVLKSLSTLQIRQGKQLDSIISMQGSLSNKDNLSFKDRFLKVLLKLPFKFLGK